MLMPFGKHRGEDLTSVPLDYLKWLESQEKLDTTLRSELQWEIQRREDDVTSRGRVIKKAR